MKHRTMKIIAFSVVFLIVTLAVPHVSLWNIDFGAGKAEAQAAPILTINPTTAYAGTVLTYSVSNAHPDWTVRRWFIKPDGSTRWNDNTCTTDSSGKCSFSRTITTDDAEGQWTEYVQVHGPDHSNKVTVTIVSTGSGSQCDTGTCTVITPDATYLLGFFVAGDCLGPENRQCFIRDRNVEDCVSCIREDVGRQVWCQSSSDSSKGYCSFKPGEGATNPTCISTHLAVSDVSQCIDNSGCTGTNLGNGNGQCKAVPQSGGFFVQGVCRLEPENVQCFFPNPSIGDCNSCINEGGEWCASPGSAASGYCKDGFSSCFSAYGTKITDKNGCSGTPAAGGTGNIILDSKTPDPIPANTQFTLRFRLPTPADSRISLLSLMLYPDSGANQLGPYSIPYAACSPTCPKQIPGQAAGTYTYQIKALDSQNREIEIGGSGRFDVVGASSTPATIIPQTCKQCLDASQDNFWCATSSGGIYNNIQGSCKIKGAQDETAIKSCVPSNYQQPYFYKDINSCPQPRTCPEQCVNYALSGSFGSVPLGTVPVGTCSTVSPAASGVSGSIGGINTGVMVRTLYGTGSAVGCDNFQDICWCTIVNPTTSGGLGIFGTTNFGLSSIPGTREIPKWPGDPEEIKNPKVAETNQLVCDAPSDATIIAKVKPQLAQAGEQVTVSGDVGKISETCTGFERTCRKITQVGCQIKDRVLGQTLSCNDCPAGSDWPGGKSYSCIGEGWKPRWSVILGIGLGVTCAFVPTNCVKAITAIGKAMGGQAAVGAYGIGLGVLPAAVRFCSAISKGIFTAGKCTDNSQCASGQCIRDTGKCVPKIPDLGDGGATDQQCSALNCTACDPDKCKLTTGCQLTSQLTCASAPGADTKEDTYICYDLTKGITCTKTKATCTNPFGPMTAVECDTRKKVAESTAATASAGGDTGTTDVKWKLCRADDNSLYCLPNCLIGDNQEGADLTHDQCVAKCGSDCETPTATPASGSQPVVASDAACNTACKNGNYDYGKCFAGRDPSSANTRGGPGTDGCSQDKVCNCYLNPRGTGAATAGGISITGRQTGYPTPSAGSAPAVGGVAGALGGAAFGLCVGLIIDRFTPALNPAACISVCGKKYETKTGPNPVCDGAVVGEQEKSYKCSAGSCEGFPNKEVQITAYDSKGEVAAQATTKTDAAGHFDYTFNAPQLEGEYSVAVVVPGLRASATATGAVTDPAAVTPLVP